MNDATIPPKNYEEWLASAPLEELVKGLFDRMNQLKEDMEAFTGQMAMARTDLTNIRNALTTHKHADTTGEATLPMGAVLAPGNGGTDGG